MRTKRPFTAQLILEWADRHHDRTGTWPTSRSGPVLGADDGTTWQGVNTALTKGVRGLPGGDSLRRLLRRRRRASDPRMAWPDLSRSKILEWIDHHHDMTGTWPDRNCGPVRGARGISWATVDRYLRNGHRKLAGGSSLADLLWEARRAKAGKPPLAEKKILRWATEHYEATGSWPVTLSGPVRHQPGESWAAIDVALRNARRGLERKTSLSRLLTEHFGHRYNRHCRPLTIEQILEWADRHHRRTDRWPSHRAGPVHGERDVTWSAVNYALLQGKRGLPGGMTLAELLDLHRRKR